MSVLELDGDNTIWPGDGATLQSSIFDVVNMLPSVVLNGTGLAIPAETTGLMPDPRFFLDWVMHLGTQPFDDPTTASRMIFNVYTGGLQSTFLIARSFTCNGQSAIIQQGFSGSLAALNHPMMQGTLRLHGRRFYAELLTFGIAPTSVTFGAFLRVI